MGSRAESIGRVAHPPLCATIAALAALPICAVAMGGMSSASFVGAGIAGEDPPRLEVEGDEVGRVGTLQVGDWAVHSRSVCNTSELPAVLSVVQTSCPCVEVTVEPRDLRPGMVATLRLRAPVVAVSNVQEHWATVEAAFADSTGTVVGTESVDLSVAYQADLAFVVHPNQLWASVVRGRDTDRRVYVRSRSLDALNIRNIRVDGGGGWRVQAANRFRVPSQLRPGEECLEIVLACRADEAGIFKSQLRFDTDDSRFSEVSIPIESRVCEYWLAEPAGFPLFLNEEGNAQTSIEQSVRIHARDRAIVPVVGARLEDENGMPAPVDGISLRILHAADRRDCTLTLRADGTKIMAPEGIRRVVLLDSEGRPMRAIPLAWIKRKP